jgi:hypothetical protein
VGVGGGFDRAAVVGVAGVGDQLQRGDGVAELVDVDLERQR